MKILMIGSSGLIGSALHASLQEQGHLLFRLVRDPSEANQQDTFFWDPAKGEPPSKNVLEGYDCIINLAGQNIASGRWTISRKQQLFDSRVKQTQLLCEGIAQLKHPPQLLINASAIGYYGDRKNELLTEEASPGIGFLADLCVAWESAANRAASNGIRVVCLRTAIVLASQGGVLAKMKVPFQLGLGGVLGNGMHYMSWIALDDLVQIVSFIIQRSDLTGAINVTSPHAVTNEVFTQTLGKVLRRPTLFKVPAWVLEAVLGEMADQLLLNSTRATPHKLLDNGYPFLYPSLEQTLEHFLKK